MHRIPELEAPRAGRETATAEPDKEEARPATDGAQEGAERRSWWLRWLGGLTGLCIKSRSQALHVAVRF